MEKIGLEAILDDADFQKGISGYEKALDSAEKKTSSTASSLGSKLGSMGKAVTDLGATAAKLTFGAMVAGATVLGGVLASTIGPASDLNETVSKVGVVFGESAGAVMDFASTSATALGMTRNEALAAAGTYGNLFRSMGMTEAASADMSTGIVQLAADLASFNNMDPSEVLEKMRAGLTGETEPLKSLGVNINQAMLETKALTMGLWDGTGALSASAKAQASYALIVEQTSLAQGDFARTSDGLANRQRILNATIGDLKSTIGTAVLPMVNALAGALVGMLNGPQMQTAVFNFSEMIRSLGEGDTFSALNYLQGVFYNLFGPVMGAQIAATLDGLYSGLQQVSSFIQTNVVPVFTQIAGVIGEFVTVHAEGLKGALIAIGAVLAGAAIAVGVLAIAGAIAALANPVTLIIGAVALLGMAWTENWGGIQEKTKAVLDFLMPFISGAMDFIQSVIHTVMSAVSSFWNRNGDTILEDAQTTWATIQAIVSRAIDLIESTVKTVMSAVSDFWERNGQTILHLAETVWSAIKNAVQTAMTLIQDLLFVAMDLINGNWHTAWLDIQALLSTRVGRDKGTDTPIRFSRARYSHCGMVGNQAGC